MNKEMKKLLVSIYKDADKICEILRDYFDDYNNSEYTNATERLMSRFVNDAFELIEDYMDELGDILEDVEELNI